MTLTTVHQESLIPLSSIMTDRHSIFIVPTFQRPFAWEKEQLQDLHEDIKKTMHILTSSPDNIHYLAPIHLIPFKASDTNHILKAYLPQNNDIDNLLNSLDIYSNKFINDVDEDLEVYFIIDGQQRLTALYFVYQFVYTSLVSRSNPLYVNLQHGNVIPRLIQNPFRDHEYFVKLLKSLKSLTKLPGHTTQAQKRMYKAVEYITTWTDWAAKSDFTRFLRGSALKTLLIKLEPKYGLTSFQVLNDRGKNLTALEKFKSLLFEYDLNYNDGILSHSIHSLFSNLYQVLDEGANSGLFPEGESGDNRLMQYIFTYIKISKDPDNYWQDGNNAYSKLREEMVETSKKGALPSLLTEWIDELKDIHEQLNHLNECLLGKEPTVISPSFICPGRNIQDDYNIIIKSLILSSRSIAVLLKFRALHNDLFGKNVEWHDRFPMDCICNPDLFKSLSDHLDQIRGKTKNKEIHSQIDLVNIPSCEQKLPYTCEYSMLQIVERMELLIWKRYNPKGTFKDTWNVVFDRRYYTAKRAVTEWYSWYPTAENDFPRMIQEDVHKTEAIFRYLLKEYESYLNKGAMIHFDTDLTLEHIFPQNPDPKPPAGYGFASENDYDRFLNRSGNLTLLYKNEKFGNKLPNIKSSLYLTVKGLTKSQPEITMRVGKQLRPLVDNPAYQDALRVRCTELALFGLGIGIK